MCGENEFFLKWYILEEVTTVAFGFVTSCSLVGCCWRPWWTLGGNRPLQNFVNYLQY